MGNGETYLLDSWVLGPLFGASNRIKAAARQIQIEQAVKFEEAGMLGQLSSRACMHRSEMKQLK